MFEAPKHLVAVLQEMDSEPRVRGRFVASEKRVGADIEPAAIQFLELLSRKALLFVTVLCDAGSGQSGEITCLELAPGFEVPDHLVSLEIKFERDGTPAEEPSKGCLCLREPFALSGDVDDFKAAERVEERLMLPQEGLEALKGLGTFVKVNERRIGLQKDRELVHEESFGGLFGRMRLEVATRENGDIKLTLD